MLRPGTYIREPDGANFVMFAPTYYNDAAMALRHHPFRDWRPVHDQEELIELEREWGSLAPGEYVEVK